MGDVAGNIAAAREMIASRIGAITVESTVMESEPWGNMESANGTAPARFMNQVLVVETDLSPHNLLQTINDIEKSMGRMRNKGFRDRRPNRIYSSRTMDIDILFYDDISMSDERLTIPHPLIRERRFVLAPLAAVMPDYVHPTYGRSIAELFEENEKSDDAAKKIL